MGERLVKGKCLFERYEKKKKMYLRTYRQYHRVQGPHHISNYMCAQVMIPRPIVSLILCFFKKKKNEKKNKQ